MARYNVNDVVTLGNTFRVAGVATDPTTVSLTVTNPAGTATTYTYAASQITKTGTGVYTKDITADTAGTWRYTWTGTGTAADVQDGSFHVYSTAALSLYAPLDDLKAWLGIEDTDSDSILELVANAASRAIDKHCNRRFYPDTTATARTFHAYGSYGVDVDDFFTTTGLVVKTDTGGNGGYATTFATTDFQVEPFTPDPGWPYTRLTAIGSYTFSQTSIPFVQVTAKWGWAAPPDQIRLAALMQAARFYKRKDSPEGVLGFGDFTVRVSNRLDPDVALMVQPFQRHAVLVG